MKVISLVLVVLLFIASVVESAFSQSKKKPQQLDQINLQKKPAIEDKQPPKRPDEIVYFVNNVRSAQPEFAADLLIRLAQSNKITDATWKSEMLEEAFRLAPSVQQPFKRRQKLNADNKPINEKERDNANWQSKVNDFAKDMANWHKEDEKSEEDYFHQKCYLYVSLLELEITRTTYDYVLRNYVSLLNEFDLQRDSRIEWFWQAYYIIRIMISVTEEMRPKLMGELDFSRNPVLYLYTELGRLAPQPFASRM
jgi:hypothetical protein